MQEKYGFVYIWYDRKHKRFYIGCRWGNEDDGYVCSSPWMRQAYKKRPHDFKRRVLCRVYDSRKTLLEEEYKWISMIKDEEIGKRYYNLYTHHFGHWSTDPNRSKTTREKMREAKLGKSNNSATKFTEGQIPWNKGTKGKMIAWNKGIEYTALKGKSRPLEVRKKISAAQKGKPRKSGMEGKHHSEETKIKIRETKRLRKKSIQTDNQIQ